MVQALVGVSKRLALVATLGSVFVLGSLAQQDPPSRVARLNYVSGNVSMQPAGVNDWAQAEMNRPFTVGDYLYTDAGASSELHLDVAAIRMGAQTSFGFLNLDDQTVQIKLTEGDISFRIHHFGPNQVFEVDTPNAAVQLLRDGVYRFRVDPNGAMSFVVVRGGQAEITGSGQAFTLNPGNSAMISGADQPSFDVERAPAPDDFDNWCAERDAREARSASARYLPPTVIGYEDLDQYGAWQQESEYGPVWYPRQVAVDWAPYHYGHWAWVEPWGWTWVDAAPWGFAPFHYGRWAYIGHRWGWCPGPIAVVGYHGPVIRPYYAPALVAWFGGAHWGVSISSGPSLGWVALAFGEIFTPSYACSRPYFNNVNVYNTRIVKTVNITNVYNTVYVNKTVYNQQFVNVHAPNAVYAMHSSAFANGQAVHQAGFAVRQADFRQMGGAVVTSPGVAPARQAFLSGPAGSAPRPQPQIINRQVVALHTPAAAPAPFAARQQYLQAHAGEVHNFAAMHREVAAPAFVAQAVRPVPQVQPVQAQPGQHFGRPETARPQSNASYQRPAPPAQPRIQTPAAQAAVPATPQQPAHGVPPNIQRNPNSEANRTARSPERPQMQSEPNRPFTGRPEPPPLAQQNRPERPVEHIAPQPPQPQHEQQPVERVAPQPPSQPQHEHSAVDHPGPRPEHRSTPEAQHSQPPTPHAQPASPPANHGEQHRDRPPESNNGDHNSGHADHKSQ